MADVEITVAPAPGGWVVRSPFSDFGLMFLSGGRAEAKASELAVRAAALGALRLFGETFRNNEQMIGLARKAGYTFGGTASDWRQVHFEKQLYRATDIPCESWKQAAMTGWLQNEAPLAVR